MTTIAEKAEGGNVHSTELNEMIRIVNSISRVYKATVTQDGTNTVVTGADGAIKYTNTMAGHNDTLAMQAAIDYVNSLGGGKIYSDGHFYLSNITMYSNISVVGNVGTTIFDFSIISTGSAIAINNEVSAYHSAHRLASDCTAGTATITLETGDGANYIAGDYIKIFDATTIGDRKRGEIVEINNVAGDVLTVTHPLQESYVVDASANKNVRLLTLVENISFEGITFIGKGMDVASVYAVSACASKNIAFNKCTFKEWGDRAVDVVDCMDVSVKQCNFHNIFYEGLGYSIVIGNASSGISIESCSFRGKGRHYIATGGGSDSYISGGLIQDIKVIGCYFDGTVVGSGSEAINTHAPFSRTGSFQITNCYFNGSSKGVELSNTNGIIQGCTFVECGYTIDLYANDANAPCSCIIEGCTFIKAVGSSSIGKMEIGYSSLENVSSVKILGCHFSGGTYIIPTDYYCDLIIDGNTFDAGSFIHSSCTEGDYGKRMIISNNIFKNCATNPIKLIRGSDTEIVGNMFYNSGYMEFMYGNNIWVKGNTFLNPTGSIARFYSTQAACGFMNNRVNDCSSTYPVYEDGTPVGGTPFIIDGNIFHTVTNPPHAATLSITSPITGHEYVTI